MNKAVKVLYLFAILAAALLSAPANAGHLFTQASANTPISLTSGNGIRITQLTYEGAGTNGNVSLNFNGDWGAGDAIKITIGSYSRTISYSSPLSGTTQTASALVVADPTLAAAGITPSGSMQWTVIAASGSFTFTGYRIYVVGKTFNGTGADTITQSQVVTESQLNGGNFVSSATSINTGLAAALDAVNGSATGQLADVITTVSAMTADSKQLALKLMAPETSQALGTSAVNTSAAAMDTVQVRLDSVRTGRTDYARQFQRNDGHHGDPSASHGPDTGSSDAEGLSSGDETLKRHMWMKGFGGKGSQDPKDGFAGFDDSIYGTMIGFDDRFPGGWIMGVALGYAKTDVNMGDFRAGDGAEIETYQLTGYFGHNFGKWYVDGMLTYAHQDYVTTRNTHLTGTAVGDFDGSLYGVRLLAGMPFSFKHDIKVTPFGGIEYNHVRQDAYTETGAGALSLNVAASTADRVRSIVGTEVSTVKELEEGGSLRPSVKASWRHEFNDDGVNTVTTLVGGGGEFVTIGQAINRNIYGMTLGLNWEKTETSVFSIELTGEAGSGYRSYSGQIMGSWSF